MSEIETRDIPLNWDVIVAPSIPIVTDDLPPGIKQRMFSPVSSTLISGKRDAVLVDALLTVEQPVALVDWIAASGKNLTMIYATHGHGDHFFGVSTVLARFQNNPVCCDAGCTQGNAPASIAAVSRVVLECAFSRSDFRSPCDCRRTDRKGH